MIPNSTRPKKGSGKYYTPRSYSRFKQDRYYRKQLLFYVLGSTAILAVLWFGGLTLLANIDTFWRLLGREVSTPITPSGEDLIPPTAPQFTEPPRATNDSQINLSGSAEPQSEVFLYHNEAETEKTFANNQGEFNFIGLSLESGDNKFYATASDAQGNVSQKSTVFNVARIENDPLLTINAPEEGTVFSGNEQRTITIEGTVEPTEVELTVNDNRAIVKSDGSFVLKLSLHKNGENEILVKAVDEAGNEVSQTIHVTYQEKD